MLEERLAKMEARQEKNEEKLAAIEKLVEHQSVEVHEISNKMNQNNEKVDNVMSDITTLLTAVNLQFTAIKNKLDVIDNSSNKENEGKKRQASEDLPPTETELEYERQLAAQQKLSEKENGGNQGKSTMGSIMGALGSILNESF